MPPQQQILLELPHPRPGTVVVNDRVTIRTEGTHRVVSVQGLVLLHYDIADRAAEACAMVSLSESGYADQNDIARAFGCSPRSLRRYQQRFESGGLLALGRPRGRPLLKTRRRTDVRDRTVLRLKEQGLSNRTIAARLGFSEKAVRKRLHRLGWMPQPELSLPFAGAESDAAPSKSPRVVGGVDDSSGSATPGRPEETVGSIEPTPTSLDVNPLDRSLDRLLAAMGQLEDAAPLFARTENLPGAGVLLAIPALAASGLLTVARKIYGSLGPAFYGLRTTLVAYVLLALLRIPRPETLKEHSPGELGRIVGLDRMLEVKTLRRKLARLASMKGSQELGREMARRRIAERGRIMGFLYVDGHARAYHGKRTIAKAYLTRTRIAGPATTDYWINDHKGDPLFVVTADANAAMSRMLVPILQEVRKLLGTDRRLTVVSTEVAGAPGCSRTFWQWTSTS